MPRVIDGDNLLGTWPGHSRSDAEKRELVRAVVRLARRDVRRSVLVFDGSEPPGVSYGKDVLYAGPGRSADAVILELLRRESDPRGFTVVTADRSLADQCRWIGASVESPKAFRDRLGSGDEGDKPQGADDVAFWLEQFGGEPDEPK